MWVGPWFCTISNRRTATILHATFSKAIFKKSLEKYFYAISIKQPLEMFIEIDLKKKLRQTLYLTGKSFRKFDNFEIYSDIELVCSRRRHVDKVYYIFMVEANMNYVDCVN